MDYVRWLIEHPDNGQDFPYYFGWEEGEKGWTADIKAAFKFDTRDEPLVNKFRRDFRGAGS